MNGMTLTCLLTYLLTPWGRVLLEKLTGFQLVKNFPAFMEPEGSLAHSQVPANCPYPEPARSSPYPHILLSEDPFNIIPPSKPGSPKWALSLRFPHQNPVYASPLPNTRFMPRPSHSSRLYHPKNIGRAVQIIKLLIMQLPPLPCYLVPPTPKYSPQHSIRKKIFSEFLKVSDGFVHPSLLTPSCTSVQTGRDLYRSGRRTASSCNRTPLTELSRFTQLTLKRPP